MLFVQRANESPHPQISLQWSDQNHGMGENEFDGLGYRGETSAQSR
jgi:hypothetical protein